MLRRVIVLSVVMIFGTGPSILPGERRWAGLTRDEGQSTHSLLVAPQAHISLNTPLADIMSPSRSLSTLSL